MEPRSCDRNAERGVGPAVLCALELFCLLGLVPLLAVVAPEFSFRRALLFVGCAYVLLRLRGKVPWRRLLSPPPAALLRGAALRGLAAVCLISAYVLICDSGHFLDFPLNRPRLWLLVFFLYPVLSALPQEIIYRIYVFEAFAPLRRHPWIAFWISGLAFGWVHVIYAGWFAVIASTPAGLILAWVYMKNRDKPGVLTALVLEHSIYGLAVFTLGVGRYFYLAR